MYFSELEIIEYFNNQQGIEVINADVIYNPIQSINITRDSNLKIILETTSKIGAETKAETIPSGMVYTNTNEIILKNKFSERTFVLSSVTPYSCKISISNNNHERIELSSIDSIKSTLKTSIEEKYLIEFVSNMDMKNFILSDNISINKSINETTTIGKINFRDTTTNEMKSWGCITNKINNCSFHICRYEKNSKIYQYILYDKIISDEERKKIRECISFILGKPKMIFFIRISWILFYHFNIWRMNWFSM